ncbi:MAG TPA: hypothetical protein VG965_07180 [Patescibacteria group bacterium]|nr:hypothetical protein [Patescibacteria group bacterium]
METSRRNFLRLGGGLALTGGLSLVGMVNLENAEKSPKFLGVGFQSYTIRRTAETGEVLKFYRYPESDNDGPLNTDEYKPKFEDFFIIYPEIYEDKQSAKWIRLKEFLTHNGRRLDAYILFNTTNIDDYKRVKFIPLKRVNFGVANGPKDIGYAEPTIGRKLRSYEIGKIIEVNKP